MAEIFATKLADVVVHSSGWWQASPKIRIVKFPLLDAANFTPKGRPMLARLSFEELVEYARVRGGKLLTMAQVFDVWSRGHRLSPVTLVNTESDTARMMSRAFCETHDDRVWDQVEALGWDGVLPIANASKDWVRDSELGAQLTTNPAMARNGGWVLGPGNAIQPGGSGSVKHGRKYRDYSQGARFAIEAAIDSDEDATPVDVATPIIAKGSKGPAVSRWQAFLRRLGYALGSSGPARNGVDGDFGERTHQATMAFQRLKGIEPSGIVDVETWRLFKVTPGPFPVVAPPAPAKPPPPVVQPPPEPQPTLWRSELYMPHLAHVVTAKKAAKHYQWAQGRDILQIVLHTMEWAEKPTTAEACAAMFATMTDRVASAHFCLDSDSVIACVPVAYQAAAAPGTNTTGVHIELAGYARQKPEDWADAYSQAMLRLAEKLTAALCLDLSIPPSFLDAESLLAGEAGITTHATVTEACKLANARKLTSSPFYNTKNPAKPRTDHSDPGKSFPMVDFIEAVTDELRRLGAEGA